MYNQSYAAIEQSLYKDKVKYVTGGNGPDAQCGGGVDCSGAIIYGIRKMANPKFPDMSAQQLYDKYSANGDGGPGTVNYYSDKAGGGIVHATTNVGNGTVINPYDEAHGITNPKAGAVSDYFTGKGGTAYSNMQLNWDLIMQTDQ
jgi:cell wall-associated NlpC family hydrolase